MTVEAFMIDSICACVSSRLVGVANTLFNEDSTQDAYVER